MVLFVIDCEGPADRRTHSEPPEEIAADHIAPALLQIVTKTNADLARREWNERHKIAEGPVILPELFEDWFGNRSVVVAGLRRALWLVKVVQIDQPIRVRTWQGTHENRVHHAENRSIRSNTQRKR